MKFCSLALVSILATVHGVATAAPWQLDAPVPAMMKARTFVNPASVTVYKDKAEELVGRWGILQPSGIVEVMSDRPASFGVTTVPVVKVTLADTKPIYRSIISNSAGVKAVIPVLDLSLTTNQKAMLQVSDVAQFIVSTMPQTSDWGDNAPDPGVGKPKLVYIAAAVLSVAETSILKKKDGGLNAFFSAISLGANQTYEEDTSSINHVLSIAIYEPTCRKLNNCGVSLIGGANLSPLQATVKGVAISESTISETLK